MKDWQHSEQGNLESDPQSYLNIVSLMENETNILEVIVKELRQVIQSRSQEGKLPSDYYCCGPSPILNFIRIKDPEFYAVLTKVLSLTGVDTSNSFIDFNKSFYPQFDWICSDAITFRRQNSLSLLNSSYHHIPDELKVGFLQNVSNNLDPNGLVIMGENFLPNYDESSRSNSVEQYYSELENFYLNKIKTLNGLNKAKLLEMVRLFKQVKKHDIELNGEFKNNILKFIEHVRLARLNIKKIVRVWPKKEIILEPSVEDIPQDFYGSCVVVMNKV